MSQDLSKSVPVRFHILNGEKVVLPCDLNQTFAQVKEKIWAKKRFTDVDQKNFIFRLLDGEVFFRDDNQVARLYNVSNVFRETLQKQSILEMLLLPESDIGDKENRKAGKPAPNGKYLLQGHLYKRGKGGGLTGGFKKRYFVFQDLTLYYFHDEKEFQSGAQAIDWVPMGSCDAVLLPDQKFKDLPFCFELKAEAAGKRDFILCAENQTDLDKWVNCIWAFNFRRVKSITVQCCEELATRGLGSNEGLFRISGNKEVVQKIKEDFDSARYPDLHEILDDHALAGVMKAAIREMHEPLLTWEKYPEWIQLAQLPANVKLLKVKEIVNTLPPSNLAFAEYLMKFLKKVSEDADTNKMTAKNLAIVFAPNILRPKVETVQTSMQDNRFVLEVVEMLIDQADEIFPQVADNTTLKAPAKSGSSQAKLGAKLAAKPGTEEKSGVSKEKAALAESQDLRKQYEATFKKWEIEAQKKKSALMAAWDMFNAELVKGVVFDTSGLSPHLQRYVSDGDDWIRKGLQHFDYVTNKFQELASYIADTRVQASKMSTEELAKRKEEETQAANARLQAQEKEQKQAQQKDAAVSAQQALAKASAEAMMKRAAGGAAGGGTLTKPITPAVTNKPAEVNSQAVFSPTNLRKTEQPKKDEPKKDAAAAGAGASKPPTGANPKAASGGTPNVLSPKAGTAATTAAHGRQQSNMAGAATGATAQPANGAHARQQSAMTPKDNAGATATAVHTKQPSTMKPAETATPAATTTAGQPDSRGRQDSAPPPPPPEDESKGAGAAAKSLGTCYALYPYGGGQRDGDIAFEVGDRIEVSAFADEQGWWEGTHQNGKKGYFPGSYVKMEGS